MECKETTKVKKVSPFSHLLENLPLSIVIISGTLITASVWWVFGVLYSGYSIVALLLFMKFICPYCSHYRHKTCPAGYHIISTRFFFPKNGKLYYDQYKRFVPLVYPIWFIPLPAALFLLFTGFSWVMICYVFVFCMTGFVILPLLSKNHCGTCENAPYCPRVNKQEKKILLNS